MTATAERKTGLATYGYYAALLCVCLASLWLRAGFPVAAIGWAAYDDMLFIRLAGRIGQGQWLGEYDNLTHAKGLAYSLFILANYATGLPLKLSEHALYLASALYLSMLVGRVYRSRPAVLLTFILLAFIPTAWNPVVGGRVVREGLYASLSLLLLALAVRCFVVHRSVCVNAGTRAPWGHLVLLGVVAGCYWLTREEGIWLLPSLLVVCACCIWSRRPLARHWRGTVFCLVLPLIPMLMLVGTINAVNYFKYGVFRNNDFRSADFQAGYGALSRIKHDAWRRHVVFPKDARQRAYRFSAAARELQPALEGSIGEFWRSVGCAQTGTTPCPEILSGWFMWALRDAVAAAGHYHSAQDAQSFYLRLAAEVEAGCNGQPDQCLPARQTLVPPWRDHYLVDTLHASWQVFKTLVTLDGAPAEVGVSLGTAQQLAIVALATNSVLAPLQDTAPGACAPGAVSVTCQDSVRLKTARWLARALSIISAIGITLAVAAWPLWLGAAIRARKPDTGLVLASALLAALAARVGLLGFLDATSIPSNNMLYLLPVTPIALALIPVTFFGIIGCARRNGSRPAPQTGQETISSNSLILTDRREPPWK